MTKEEISKMSREEAYKHFRKKITDCKTVAQEVNMYCNDNEYLMLKEHLSNLRKNAIQENRKENKKLIGRNVFVNKNNGERFLTIEEIKQEKAYRLIHETKDIETAFFCDTYEKLTEKILSFDTNEKLTVYCLISKA